MPGSANFIGEFYILNGLFDEETVYAVIATAGVAMAAFYALRLYQKTMHNRLPAGVESRELTVRDASVLVPLVLVIIGTALYPTLILNRGEAAVQDKVGAVAPAQEADELVSRP
jgi:NADH-quinone oxidoreductase subunit M